MSSLALHSQAPLPGPETTVPMLAGQAINLHANVLGFDNGFVLAGIIVLLSLPLAMLLRKGQVADRTRPAGR
jgi:hypothetical protein